MDINSLLSYEAFAVRETKNKAKRTVTISLLYCILLLLLQICLALFIPVSDSNILNLLSNMAVYIVSLTIPLLLVNRLFKSYCNNNYSLIKRSAPQKPVLYILGSVGFGYFVNLICNTLLGWFLNDYQVSTEIIAETPSEIIICYILYAILPSIIEEWAFRGTLLKNLLPYGKSGAIFISSLLFGIVHIDPPRIIFATIFGIALAYCYEYTGSIKIPIIIHFINNAISVTISILPEDSIFFVFLALSIYLFIGVAIGAISYYSKNGIKQQKVSLIKTSYPVYQLNFANYILRLVSNFAIIPLVIIYFFLFSLYYLI